MLNGLVSAGAIAGFRTTFGVDNGAGAPLVAVTAPEGRSPHDLKVLVMDAPAGVAIGINVAVEERSDPDPG